MKRLLTADLHIHNHFNNPIFVQIGVDYLKYITTYCKKNEITTIDILGDLFHISSKINIEIFLPVFKQFEKMKKEGLEINIISGNHEVHTANSGTILDSLIPYCNVITEYTKEEHSDIVYHYLPFERSPDFSKIETVDGAVNILFSHLNVAGFKLNEHLLSKGITLKDARFDFIFLGDIHIHQHINNIIYCGSPYQQNWGEVGQKKGFLVYDDVINNWEFIEYKNAPKFKILTPEQAIKEKVENNFIKLKITNKVDNLSKLREVLYDKGAIEILQEFAPAEQIKQEHKDDINVSNNLEDIIKEYITQDSTQLDKSKLEKLFVKILQG